MGLFGAIGRALVNPMTLAQVAMGPAGWASLAVRTIGTAIGQQVIQQLGQRLGLPQGMISMAQNAFAAATGSQGGPLTIRDAVNQLADQFNLSPSQQGQLERTANQSFDNINRILENNLRRAANGSGEEEGGSILMRIARSLGQLMDEKMETLASKADALGRVGSQSGNVHRSGANENGFTAQGQSQFGKLSAEVQALGQEIGYLSQAISQTIKGIGEAASTVARK